MKVYRIKSVFRALISGLTFFIVFLFLLMVTVRFIPISADIKIINAMKRTWPTENWLYFLYFILSVILYLIRITTEHRKIIITDTSIISSTIFYRKELEFNGIKGFSTMVNPTFPFLKFVSIIPVLSNKKIITLTSWFENIDEILFYLSSHTVNLDLELSERNRHKNQIEEQEILQNIQFGSSIEDRESRLKKAHLVAKTLNIIGVFTAVWIILFPKPYKLAVVAGVLMPIIAILTIKFFSGIILVEDGRVTVKPSVSGALFVPGLALVLKSVFYFQVDDYSNVWIPVILVSMLFVGLLVIANKEFCLKQGKTYVKMIVLMIPMLFYSYGAIILLNCCFDKSTPKILTTTIMNRETEGEGFTTTYFLNLNTWHKEKDVEKILVKKDLYDQLQEGDEIAVYIFKGKFNISWIIVDRVR